MPATTNVNLKTVVHAGSSGVAMSFPDVCKTPTPGGPVPIPYPNIAQSADTADGSSSVQVDGQPIMLKNSSFRLSTGDEAGAAMGVVSNKIKGKAAPVAYSFDVKVEGQNVFRLGDPMLTNCGSTPNAQCPFEVQPPKNPGLSEARLEACQKTREKSDEGRDELNAQVAMDESGILEAHWEPIRRITQEMDLVVYYRKNQKACRKWIEQQHQPKPHDCINGQGVKPPGTPGDRSVEQVAAWFAQQDRLRRSRERLIGDRRSPPLRTPPLPDPAAYLAEAAEYVGITAVPIDDEHRQPRPGGKRYPAKWTTSDYDIWDVILNQGHCQRAIATVFDEYKLAINKALHWPAIQHGYQTAWVTNAEDIHKGAQAFSMSAQVRHILKNLRELWQAERERAITPAAAAAERAKMAEDKVRVARDPNPQWKEGDPQDKRYIDRRLAVVDKEVTVVVGSCAYTLQTRVDVLDALNCKGCGG